MIFGNKRALILINLVFITSSFVVAMDNHPIVHLHPLPTIVCNDLQQFERRYKHILRQNMTRISIALSHQPEEMRRARVHNYEQLMLGELRTILGRQRRHDCASSTMTNANAS